MKVVYVERFGNSAYYSVRDLGVDEKTGEYAVPERHEINNRYGYFVCCEQFGNLLLDFMNTNDDQDGLAAGLCLDWLREFPDAARQMCEQAPDEFRRVAYVLYLTHRAGTFADRGGTWTVGQGKADAFWENELFR